MITDAAKPGHVKWFNPQKGFGFIDDDQSPGNPVFVHLSAVEASGLQFLYEGQSLRFEAVSRDGKRAARKLWVSQQESLAQAIVPVDESDLAHLDVRLIESCTAQLVQALQKDPQNLYNMHPAAFEELVAKIWENDGYVVEFNKAWNQADGGVDIIAVRKEGPIPFRMAIQCKRYSRTNKITAEPIRSLSGVLDRYQAHAGVVATTSFFTEPAVMEARSHIWKVGLQDYDDIVAGLMKLKIDGTAP